MKTFRQILLLAALLLSAVVLFSSYSPIRVTSNCNECPPAGQMPDQAVLLPDTDDCSVFFSCSDEAPILTHCPEDHASVTFFFTNLKMND